MWRWSAWFAAGAFAAFLTLPAAQAADPCEAFTWDVSHERAVFALEPRTVMAGRDAASAPALEADTLYSLQLRPQSEVSFALPPGSRKTPPGKVYAGIASFGIPIAGIYRVSADQPIWFDVITGGVSVPSRDFQGRPGCSTPHKVVEFDLPGGALLTLQASGGVNASARLAVTRAPPAAAVVAGAPAGAAMSGGPINVLYAGSLVSLMERSVGPAFTKASGHEFRGYAGGSNKLANEIRGQLRRGDVFISANPKVDDALEGTANGDWVHWYLLFAQSPLVIAYGPSSRFAAEFAKKPWYEVLSEPGIRIGRTDPKLDPKGAFTVELLQRAEEFYHRPGLSKTVLGEPDNAAQVLPEEVLVGRFQSGELDVGFFYSTEATDAKMTFVKPIAEIDPQARYTVTVLRDAFDPVGAAQFVGFLLGGEGQELLRRAGLEVVAPVVSGDRAVLPASLRSILDARR